MGSTEDETVREKRTPIPAAYERPQIEVTIDKPFAIGKYHVTVGEFDRFVKATARAVFDGCNVDDRGKWSLQANRSYLDPLFVQHSGHPAVCITWDDAVAYVAWLSSETGHRYRLLREAEWEYAARGGTTTARWWGDSQTDICTHANGADQSFERANPGDKQANLVCDDGYAATNPVSKFPANQFGLHDMLGNAWQWTSECFRERHDSPEPDETQCKRRVIRGGSWHNASNVLRSANRFWLTPNNRSSSIGFRVARDRD
jgi:formylglycine-generating enzyme required for sulfatase activity